MDLEDEDVPKQIRLREMKMNIQLSLIHRGADACDISLVHSVGFLQCKCGLRANESSRMGLLENLVIEFLEKPGPAFGRNRGKMALFMR